MNNVAVVYHYLAHYREAVFRELCANDGDERYTLFSGKASNIRSLATIDPQLASKPIECGGLRWRFVKNLFVGKVLLQTGVLRLSITREFDTIIFLGNAYYLTTWMAAFLARLRGKRVLMWSHGFNQEDRVIVNWLRLRLYRLAHGMLLYGNRSAHICKRMGLDPDSLYVILNSLDYRQILQVRQKIEAKTLATPLDDQKAPSARGTLISVGRLVYRKRLDLLLNAVALLDRRGCCVRLLLVGDGPEKDKLVKLANKLGVGDRVTFFGACHDENALGPLIYSSDVCVIPNHVGLGAIHALSYGTPVITHNKPDKHSPEFEAIIKGRTGDFFEYENIEDMADVISQWLVQKKERDSVRSSCYQIVDNYYNPGYQVEMINRAVRGIPAHLCPKAKTAYPDIFESR